MPNMSLYCGPLFDPSTVLQAASDDGLIINKHRCIAEILALNYIKNTAGM